MNIKHAFLIILFSILSAVAFSHSGEEANYHFTANAGQLDQKVKFHCKLHVGDIYFEKNQFTFDLSSGEDLNRAYNIRHDRKLRKLYGKTPVKIRKHSYSMEFLGANLGSSIVPSGKESFYKNYIRGKNPDNWYSRVSSYEKLSYKDIYQNINVDVYQNENSLKYDFIVSKGGDPNDIKIAYNNVDGLNLNQGILEIEISTGVVKEMKPIAYQIINGEKNFVECHFNLEGKDVSFNFPKGYDSDYELVIDPTWIFSTLTGSTADNWGFTATYDDNENFYGGGIADGAGYPTSPGAYDITFGGTWDAVITKYNPQGTAIVYSTYIGGSGADQPHSLVTDADSNLVIMGVTSSNDFPTTPLAYDQFFNGGTNLTEDGITYSNGTDIYVMKLNNTGTAPIGSTYLGGASNDGFSLDVNLKFNYADHARGEVVLDVNDDVLIASSTFSNNFPTTAFAHSQLQFGGYDGVVCKLSANLTSLIWSTYIGGTSADAAYSIRIDAVNNKAFVCGGTTSNNINPTGGVIGPAYSGATDGFIAKFDNTNGALDALTYIGTNGYDQTYIIEVGQYQQIYVVGQTKGPYPVSPLTYTNVNSNQFIHKMNNDLTVTDFSTVFGTSADPNVNISISAFLVDNCDNIYVSGWGGNVNNEGTTAGMPITANALQPTTDGSDFYFIVFDRDAQNLLYATYFGTSGGLAGEHVDGGTSRFDKKGTIYQGVCAGCGGGSFPTSPGAYSSTNGSGNCNFGAIKIGLDFQGVIANANPPPNQTLCGAPYNLTFSAGNPAPPYNYWDFGDGIGTATNNNNPGYTYADTGSYTVMYVAIDSATCNIADTVYFNVNVILNDSLDATFNFPPPDPCADSMLVQLDFTGTGADSLFWDMGNGTTFEGDTSVTYYYTTPGTYIINFEAYDTLCNNFYTISDTVEFNPVLTSVTANPPAPFLLCGTPYIVSFTGNNPVPPNSYWDFGDGVGTATNDNNPTYTYAAPGAYNVMYVVIDSSTCNIADTVFFSVVLTLAPPFSATIGFEPPPPCNTMDSFMVELAFTGIGADSLLWDLGDGTQFTSNAVSYVYSNSGTYIITMTAYNDLCGDQSVSSEVTFTDFKGTESVIPNVFTPNDDVVWNDELQFIGIDNTAEYSIQIFNRWGLKVYEGENALVNWDGGSHGEGTYFYILKYTDICSKEEKLSKGFVTLFK
jgi:gliding motility-associated-like protein